MISCDSIMVLGILDIYGLTSRKTADELILVYEKFEMDGGNATVSYLQLCMISRFFLRLSNSYD